MESRRVIFSRRKVNKSAMLRSRSGGLLILVLVIMGVAVILITSALSITMAARKHYYDDALTSQSNLTATSVAKTLGAAVTSGDITSGDLETLAAAGSSVKIPVTSSSSPTINAASSGNNAVAPGLSGKATSISTSTTTVSFSYYPNNTARTYIKMTVVTRLKADASTDQEEHTVSVLLKRETSTSNVGAFANEITLGVAGSGVWNDIPQILIGTAPPATGASNYVVVHGDIQTAASGSNNYTSDVIVTGHIVFGGDTVLQGNLIFAGDGAAIAPSPKTGKYGGTFTVNKYLLALGTTSTSSLTTLPSLGGGGGWSIKKAIYITNKTFADSENWNNLPALEGTIGGANSNISYRYSGINAYMVDPTASVTIDGTKVATATTDPAVLAVAAAAKAEADKYTTVLTNNVTRKVLTSAEAFAKGYSKYATPQAVRDAVTAGSVTQLTAAMLSGIDTIPEAAEYCIDLAAGTTVLGGASSPAILTFDISSIEKTIYVIGSDLQTLTITDLGLINFTRTSGNNFGKIVLLGGCDIKLNQNAKSNDSGIIGSTHNTAPSATARTTYVPGNPIFLYIYGMGESPNIMSLNYGITIEGYIGLYGPSGQITAAGGGDPPHIYGRYEGSTFVNAGGNALTFPYAPTPGNSFIPGGAETPIPPAFKVAGYLTEA